EIRAVVARPVRALAVLSALGGKLGMETGADEGVRVWTGDDVNRSAVAAIAAARTAARHALFAPKGETPAAAPARHHVDVYFVDKHENWRVGEFTNSPTSLFKPAGC